MDIKLADMRAPLDEGEGEGEGGEPEEVAHKGLDMAALVVQQTP